MDQQQRKPSFPADLTLSLPTLAVFYDVADRRLGTPPLTLSNSLRLQTLCSVKSVLDFDTLNLGYF